MASEVRYEDIIEDYQSMVSTLTYENLCYKRVVAQLEKEVTLLRNQSRITEKDINDALDE
jgi:hypothetical protein